MKVLILGASSGTGRELTKQALVQRHQIMAFVRDASQFRNTYARLTVAPVNIVDPIAVEQSIRGQDVVISALGASRSLHPQLCRGCAEYY